MASSTRADAKRRRVAMVCGFLGEKIDWHLGFGVAGIGMCFGLVLAALSRPIRGLMGGVR